MIDTATKWIVIAPWGLWLVWEIVLLVLRGKGHDVRTISMAAKDLGFGGLTSICFAWSGLAAHFWITWNRPVWSFPWLGVLFWAILVAYIGTDILTSWRPELWPAWMRWARYPPLVVAFGLFAGWFMFPQRGNWTP